MHTIDPLPETTLSYASVMGIKQDINLTGDDYQWLSSMFYFGQLMRNGHGYDAPPFGRSARADYQKGTSLGNIPLTGCCNGFPWRNTRPFV